MKAIHLTAHFLSILFLSASLFAAERPEKSFEGTVHHDIKIAISSAKQQHKPVFAFVYDSRSKTKSRLDTITSFLSAGADRKLLNEKFIQALVPLNTPSMQQYYPQKDLLELCEILVIDEDGNVITRRPIVAQRGDKVIGMILEEVSKAKK